MARAWAMVTALAKDAEPRVRQEAIAALALFDYDHVQAALQQMESDADPQVAAAARETRAILKRFRDLNPDLEY